VNMQIPTQHTNNPSWLLMFVIAYLWSIHGTYSMVKSIIALHCHNHKPLPTIIHYFRPFHKLLAIAYDHCILVSRSFQKLLSSSAVMILTKASKLFTAQLHVLCILLVSQLTHSIDNTASNEDHQDQASRDLVSTPYFNLRLFWQKGYRWQESTRETFWCLTCDNSDCDQGSKVEVKWCDRDDSRQQWYFDNGKVRSRKNKSQCLQRYGREIRLRSCTRSKYQKWAGLRKDMPFEMQIPGSTEKCISQHHHPKEGEELYMEDCKLAEKTDTSHWVVY
jgi:hypothetical protein